MTTPDFHADSSQAAARPAPIPVTASIFASPPETLAGRIAGVLMALLNGPQNRMTVELLEVRPEDRVLEIGFGPGTCLRLLAKRASAGFVAGVELSDAMMRAAARRNRAAVRRGQMELRRGSVSAIPYEDERFDKVCTVNTIYFWPDPERDAAEILRVLRPGGSAAICFRGEPPAGEKPTRSLPPYPSDAVVEAMRRAGFVGLRVETRQVPLIISTCVLARKP